MTDEEALGLLERLADGDVSEDIKLEEGDKLIELGNQLERLDGLIDRSEEALKIVKKMRANVGESLIPDVMRNRGLIKNNGTGNYALPSGNKVSLRNSTKPGIRVDQQAHAYEWFVGEGAHLDVVYRSRGGKYKVADQELLAAVKAIRKAGRNVPPFIGTFEIVKAIIINPRKAKETAEDE